ncbi:DUF6338 family protein [Nitrincola sp. MINF-07-Sa-05]|uniref:DUF6338 family protein n=1 Tax=Nitrincola salilacus TaxID=3400273 RepID=UPI0039185D02
MSIWDLDKLLLFIAFVIPGFISIKVYELIVPSVTRGSSKQLIDAIAYSCINYALLIWPILEIEASSIRLSHPTAYKLFYLLVLFVFPVIWVVLWRWARGLELIQRNLPHPTGKPWDYVFSQRQWYWVVVTLKDGRKVAGKYGRNSFSSSSPAPEQIYLEETWVINEDGGFDRPRVSTAGTIILADQIATLELFQYSE